MSHESYDGRRKKYLHANYQLGNSMARKCHCLPSYGGYYSHRQGQKWIIGPWAKVLLNSKEAKFTKMEKLRRSLDPSQWGCKYQGFRFKGFQLLLGTQSFSHHQNLSSVKWICSTVLTPSNTSLQRQSATWNLIAPTYPTNGAAVATTIVQLWYI